MGCAIIGIGKGIPDLEVKNDDLKALVDTNDEWISSRTGIKRRRIAVAETSADLGERAARGALGWDDTGFVERRIDPDEVDLVICATITPDSLAPSASNVIRRRLGLTNAIAFDVNAACAGFIYSITVAESMMAASLAGVPGVAGRNPIRRALVVSVERLSRIVNWKDRNTCVLFGDGAGAAMLEWDESRPGVISSYLVNEDDDSGALTCMAGYEATQPFTTTGVTPEAMEYSDVSFDSADTELATIESVKAGEPRQVLRMDGAKVFKYSTAALTNDIYGALKRANLKLDDIKCIVPHQANLRIIKYTAKKIDRPMDFFHIAFEDIGNTSSASIPIALVDAYRTKRIVPGDKIMLAAFGAGFTSGAMVYEA